MPTDVAQGSMLDRAANIQGPRATTAFVPALAFVRTLAGPRTEEGVEPGSVDASAGRASFPIGEQGFSAGPDPQTH